MVGIDPEDNDSEDNIKKHIEKHYESTCDSVEDVDGDGTVKQENGEEMLGEQKDYTFTHGLNLSSSLSSLPSPTQQNPTNLLGPHRFDGEPYSTTKTPTFEATIDYIFHNPALTVSEAVVDNLLHFIPNNNTPSDHRVGVVGFVW
eukprot:gnl/Chilomastix_caulleri/1583.p1 GENE.gnl/Chilomastix_caulleri/1583~~gnl/Chilomastix_caulleri/1583.p1  ORF type:complete len:145 (+),score=31.57 gnl/Chilomastix_caulleri/1583:1-435(+)